MDDWVFAILISIGAVSILVGAVLFFDYWMRRHLDRNNDGIIDDWEESHPELKEDE